MGLLSDSADHISLDINDMMTEPGSDGALISLLHVCYLPARLTGACFWGENKM